MTQEERRREDALKRNREELQLIIAEEKSTTQLEKDLIHLKRIELSIAPGSRWWRWGYLGSIRRARWALEREGKRKGGTD